MLIITGENRGRLRHPVNVNNLKLIIINSLNIVPVLLIFKSKRFASVFSEASLKSNSPILSTLLPVAQRRRPKWSFGHTAIVGPTSVRRVYS